MRPGLLLLLLPCFLATTTTTVHSFSTSFVRRSLPKSTTAWRHHHSPTSARSKQRSHHDPLNFSSSSSSSISLTDDDNDAEQQPPPSKSKILSAALLIAGITVGGGFLALPIVVAPTGFYPAATAMVGVWAFLGSQALVVVDVLVAACRNRCTSTSSADVVPGMGYAAKLAFDNPFAERLVSLLLVLVVEATLVSQISRAGAMLSTTSLTAYRMGCALASLSVAGIVFGPCQKQQVVTNLNSILTMVFLCMAVLLFVMGIPAANWSLLGVPQLWKTLPQSIPTFLQLLVYGEILPTVCQYLDYQVRPIQWAIAIGSLLPLILEVGWAALGMGLRPTTTGLMPKDPVTLLLTTGPIQIPLLCLALSAILTTILGSYLALQSTFDDLVWSLAGSSKKTASENTSSDIQDPAAASKRSNRLWSAIWIVLPALGIASISPALFLKAIDFAGSYPVLFLWGIAPPLMALKLRKTTAANEQVDRRPQETGLPTWWIKSLLVLSLGLFGMSAIPDLVSLARFVVRFASGLKS